MPLRQGLVEVALIVAIALAVTGTTPFWDGPLWQPLLIQLTERRGWVKTEREPLEPPPRIRVPGGVPLGTGVDPRPAFAHLVRALRHRGGNDGKPLRAVPDPSEAVRQRAVLTRKRHHGPQSLRRAASRCS
jgi:hypothetical protein